MGFHVDERELRAFYSVAHAGRMDLAAKELGYSQPAISYQIKCLEQSIGFKLFTRDAVGVRITREGQMILPSVRALLSLIEGIRSTAPEPVGDEASTATARRRDRRTHADPLAARDDCPGRGAPDELR